MFAKLIPEDKAGELFGFYNTFGRAGSVLGPLLINIFLSYSNDLKVALIPLAIIFLIGLVLLYFVKERSNYSVKNQLFFIVSWDCLAYLLLGLLGIYLIYPYT